MLVYNQHEDNALGGADSDGAAQRLEQGTHNALVVGSNPPAITNLQQLIAEVLLLNDLYISSESQIQLIGIEDRLRNLSLLMPLIIRELVAHNEASQWQQIDSAPIKTSVLVYDGEDVLEAYYSVNGYVSFSGWFVRNNGDYIDGGYGRDYKMGEGEYYPRLPTHWMPLPAPPQGDK